MRTEFSEMDKQKPSFGFSKKTLKRRCKRLATEEVDILFKETQVKKCSQELAPHSRTSFTEAGSSTSIEVFQVVFYLSSYT